MGKREVVLVLVLVLFLSVNVLALEKTRIHGNVLPGAGLTLKLSYYADGQAYNDQVVTKTADTWGNWEHKMLSDAGVIGLKVNSGGFEKTFEIPSGTDFEVKLNDEAPVEETNDSANNTEEVTADIQEAEEETEKQEEKTGFLSGFFIFPKDGNSTNSSFGILLIFLGLFITVLIANFVSHGIINLIGRKQETGISKPINVVKLSDRLKEQKEENATEERRRQKEFGEWERKKREKEEKIKQLQERLNELEKE